MVNESAARAAPKITDAQQKALDALAEGSLISEAAEAAGVHRGTLLRWRKDSPFAELWAEADDAGCDELEETLHVCAKKAQDDPRYIGALIFSLCNRRPQRWRNKRTVEHEGKVNLTLSELSDDELERLIEVGGAKTKGADDADS